MRFTTQNHHPTTRTFTYLSNPVRTPLDKAFTGLNNCNNIWLVSPDSYPRIPKYPKKHTVDGSEIPFPTTWEHNNGITYQPQLVSLPDF